MTFGIEFGTKKKVGWKVKYTCELIKSWHGKLFRSNFLLQKSVRFDCNSGVQKVIQNEPWCVAKNDPILGPKTDPRTLVFLSIRTGFWTPVSDKSPCLWRLDPPQKRPKSVVKGGGLDPPKTGPNLKTGRRPAKRLQSAGDARCVNRSRALFFSKPQSGKYTLRRWNIQVRTIWPQSRIFRRNPIRGGVPPSADPRSEVPKYPPPKSSGFGIPKWRDSGTISWR